MRSAHRIHTYFLATPRDCPPQSRNQTQPDSSRHSPLLRAACLLALTTALVACQTPAPNNSNASLDTPQHSGGHAGTSGRSRDANSTSTLAHDQQPSTQPSHAAPASADNPSPAPAANAPSSSNPASASASTPARKTAQSSQSPHLGIPPAQSTAAGTLPSSISLGLRDPNPPAASPASSSLAITPVPAADATAKQPPRGLSLDALLTPADPAAINPPTRTPTLPDTDLPATGNSKAASSLNILRTQDGKDIAPVRTRAKRSTCSPTCRPRV